jgi:hypothetical protein
VKGANEFAFPGPVTLNAKSDPPATSHDARGHVQERVAQTLGFGRGECRVQAERLGPRHEVHGAQHELQPGVVGHHVAKREVRQARGLGVADAVFDARVSALT